ncbi:MAG: type VI secretion system baseplate subunit TssF [Pseudomonadota bacterium]
MSRRDHFREELQRLNELREQAAAEHWDLARFLKPESTDPDVERLFEGFAFLTGRVQERLDDEFPELLHTLLGLWWPHYLRPLPAMAVLQFEPVANAYQETQTVRTGVQVQSRPVNGHRCRFRTTSPLALHPWSLREVRVEPRAGREQVTLDFSLWPGARFDESGDGLVLYLGAPLPEDLGDACDLYWLLREHVEAGELTCLDEQGEVVARCPLGADPLLSTGQAAAVSPPAGAEEPAAGYLALQEAFCFPAGRLFLRLRNWAKAADFLNREGQPRVRLQFSLARPYAGGAAAHTMVHINCVSITNLYEASARPIVVDGERFDYPLELKQAGESGVRELYEVDAAQALVEGEAEPRRLVRFDSFDALASGANHDWYQLRFTRVGGMQPGSARLQFGFEDDPLGKPRTVSVDVTCSDGDLCEAIGRGEINVATSTSPEFATFRNLTRPTRYLRPHLDDRLLWDLVASMASSFDTLLDTKALRSVLKRFDFLGRVDAREGRRVDTLLSGLEVTRTGPANRLFKGHLVRGHATEITLSSRAFESTGAMYVFGCALERFMAAFATVNMFHELTVVDRDSREEFRWTPTTGPRSSF